MQNLIKQLLQNPKIKQISILNDYDGEPYAAVSYLARNHTIYDILLSLPDLHWLMHPIRIEGKGRPYVRLVLPEGYLYLHRLIAEPDEASVAHHIHNKFTLDNRRSYLQVVETNIHRSFHSKAPRSRWKKKKKADVVAVHPIT